MKLNRQEIEAIIPHRPPMLLVDEVKALEPGVSIEAEFHVDPAMALFKGHFPGEPMLPGVYSVECMAQASDLLILSMEGYKGKVPLFLGIDNVKFKRKILPGELLTIRAVLKAHRPEKAIVTCSGEIFVCEELAVSGDVTLALR